MSFLNKISRFFNKDSSYDEVEKYTQSLLKEMVDDGLINKTGDDKYIISDIGKSLVKGGREDFDRFTELKESEKDLK